MRFKIYSKADLLLDLTVAHVDHAFVMTRFRQALVESAALFAGLVEWSDTEEWYVAAQDSTKWHQITYQLTGNPEAQPWDAWGVGRHLLPRLKVCGPDQEIFLEVE